MINHSHKHTATMKIVLCYIIFAVLGFAIAPALHAQTPVTLRVGGAGGFKLPDKNATDPQGRANRAIVDAFERAHPDIHLESAQGLQIGGPGAESNLLLAFAGGTAPDVVYVNFRSSASYIQQGFLLPLDEELKRDPDVLAHIQPTLLPILKDAGHGHIYSIPFLAAVQALYYRKDMFQQAGLDPDKPPQNWDEFYADAQALTDQPKGVWGFEFGTDSDASAYWWINFLWQANGEVIKRNPQGQWVAAFNTPAGVTALEFYEKLLTAPWKGKDGKTYIGVATHSSTLGEDRATAKVAMWFQYQSNVIANQADATQINPSVVGIAPMPKGPTGITANEANAYMYGISSQIKDSRIREAAWQFVKFMASDDADRIRTKSYVEAGLGNTVNPVALQKYGYEDYTSPQSKVWLKTNEALFTHGHPEPYGENMSQIYNLLGVPLGEIEQNPNADPKALLDKAARAVDAKLTGYVAPSVMRARRTWAWTVFAIIFVGTGLYLGNLVKRWLEARDTERRGRLFTTRQTGLPLSVHLIIWLFMLPAVLSILIWRYYPLGRGLVMAFQDYHILGSSHFVGLDNFIDLFSADTFWYSVRNSFLYTGISLTLGFFLPIAVAFGLTEVPRGKIFFRTLYYLPAITAPLAISFMWKWFEDGTPNGLFNSLLLSAAQTFGLHPDPVKWLDNPKIALLAVILPAIWASAGPGSLIYQAALRSIPDEMYEAADLDGAGIWTKIWRVTLPTLKPLIIINLVGAVIGSFQATDNILVMTGGGPLYSTQTLGLEIWYNAFLFLKFGYATAAAWVMGALLIGFTMYQLRIMKDLRFAAARG
jgi:ABC-type sugar transport system permease subunit/ABC-type glycerol-3-phosphate transport system substrate-binding protein